MFSRLASLLTLACALSAVAIPIRREVPQEHSHEQFLTTVRASLNINNPDGIVDPVFGLLGNAAAAQGLGKITDATCLQQATADRAFTNAKAKGDVKGMTAALIFRALERNSGTVGGVTAACTSIKAVNPEIAALSQHQDPASANAKAVNKAITLELAKQIAKIGGDPQDALKAGTFAPGDVNDRTGKGNTCDNTDDPVGCIFTQNKLVPDATAAEITAAVGGAAAGNTGNTGNTGATGSSSACPADVTVQATVTVTVAAAAATATAAPATNNAATNTGSAAASGNLQKFTGALGGAKAPTVTKGGRGFQVEASDDFLNLAAAIGRSCDIQKNKCANIANSAAGRSSGLTVGQCDTQNGQCRAANN